MANASAGHARHSPASGKEDHAPPTSPFRASPFAGRLHDTSPLGSPGEKPPDDSFMEDLSVDERRVLLDALS
jgi:hypothetical protein